MDKLFYKDFKSNIFRGLKLIRALNLDPNAAVGPIRVEIAASSACNYRCWFCASHSYLYPDRIEPLFLSDELMRSLFNDLKKLHVTELLFSGNGEPLLSKAMIREIKQNGKKFLIEILSNGGNLSAVDEELFRNLQYLTISLNSGNGKSHQITHGYKGENQFPGIVNNIERLLNISGANKKIKLNYVITAENYEEIDDLIKMAAKWDVIFSARPVKADDQALRGKTLDRQMLENLDKKATQYLAGSNLSGRLSLSLQLIKRACQINYQDSVKSTKLYPCYVGFFDPYITSNGDVLICVSGQEHPFGNLNEESFQSIWQKRQNLAFRIMATQMHKTNQMAFSACRNCVNVQYHSLAFHNIYSKIPVLPGLLENRSRKLDSNITDKKGA